MSGDKRILAYGFRRLAVIFVLCIALAHPAFAASADDDGAVKKEQWVFLLAEPEDDSSCAFYAKPSLAGYESGEDTEILLHMSIGGKQYEIELYRADNGWYISGQYDIAGDAWRMDYEVDVRMSSGEAVVAEAHFTNRDMAAQWPEVTDGKLELTLDKEGRLEKNEFEWHQWITENKSPLFTYKISDEKDCIVNLKQDKIIIEKAADDSSFSVIVSDPSGNRRMAQVSIVVASQAGKGVIIGIGAVVVIVLIVAAIFKLKEFGNINPGGNNKDNRLQKIAEAKKEVDTVYSNISRLFRKCETRKKEIEETYIAAEERVRSDGQASAYSPEDVRKIAECADALEENEGYGSLKPMVPVLSGVSNDLRKMQAREKPSVRKGAREIEIAKNYLDADKRKEFFAAISADETVLEGWLTGADAVLEELKFIAYHEETPFAKNIEILVDDGKTQYKGRRVAKSMYGLPQPGAFALDDVKLLANESWKALTDILGHRTGIRIFAIDQGHVRVVAPETIFMIDGDKTGILEFSYEQDAEFLVDGAKITLQFK